MSNATGFIGVAAGSSGVVTVTGAGSQWNNSGNLQIGPSGSGTLNVTNGGMVTVGGLLTVGPRGTLKGNGTIVGNVFQSGLGRGPGQFSRRAHDHRQLHIRLRAALQIELGGTTPGTEYDQLLVSGQVARGWQRSTCRSQRLHPAIR